MTYLAAFGSALVLALVWTPVVRALAWRRGFVARPRLDRWHRRPTALAGGVAVCAATLGGGLAAGLPPWPLAVLALAAFGVFAVGLVDDLVTLTPATKLTFQVVAASVALAGGVRLEWTGWQTIDSVLTVLWLIGLSNAFNFLDNMDGACAGVGSMAALSMTAIGIWGGGPGSASTVWASALAGALLGFLVFNFKPATIFLGDSGSLFIGFMVAGLAALTHGPQTPATFSAVALPTLLVLVPIFDTTLVTVTRKLSGRPASQGGTDHTTHRLVALGFSESRAVLFLYLLSAVSGVGALMVSRAGSGAEVIVVLLGVASLLLAAALLRVRVYGDADYSLLLRGSARSPVIAALVRHRAFELLVDVILIVASSYAAYRIRFDSQVFATYFFKTFLATLPLLLASYVVGLWLAGVYANGQHRFRLADLWPLAKGVTFGTAASVLAVVYLYRLENISRGVIAIQAFLLACFLVASRLVIRGLPAREARAIGSRARTTLAYGAGVRGAILVGELAGHGMPGYHLVGFIDDDPEKAGRSIRNVPVLGGWDAGRALVERGEIGALIVTSDKVNGHGLAVLGEACLDAGIPILRFRWVFEQVDGRRAVALEETSAPQAGAANAEAPRHG